MQQCSSKKNETINIKKPIVVSYIFSPFNTVRAHIVYKHLKEYGGAKVIYADYDHYSKKHCKYENKDFISIHVPAYKRNISVMRIISCMCFAFKLPNVLNQLKPDLIYVVFPPNIMAYITVKWAKKFGIKTIIDVVDLHPESLPISEKIKNIANYFGLRLWRALRDRAVSDADFIITECDYYVNFLNLKGKSNVQTVYLAKDAAYPENIEKDNDECLNIAYLGSMGNIYDFEALMEIGKGLNKLNRKCKFHIIGDGERKNWLIDNLEKNKINYHYYGKVYDDSLKREILTKCHFGFNGFKENTNVGLSYKSIDYFYFGLPIINSCKLDTWQLVKTYKIGFNYSTNNLGEIISKVASLSKEDIYKMKVNAMNIYLDNFTIDIFNNKMKRIIQSLFEK